MAGAIIEVKYFNTFILKKINTSQKPIWNGSFGIPGGTSSNGLLGYPAFTSGVGDDESWAIEESRIRGGYNNTTVDFGAKAYLVEDEPNGTRRFNALIYSGIFNSRTGINQTNVFSVGEEITKATDPANGSIQKLYAEDTNLTIFQELKVSRALIDKDAIYAAEGGGTVTASNLVIGVIQPYAGKYGISTNPESFGVFGYRKYFADLNNNSILRLSQDGIVQISSYGMKDFFRDRLANVNQAYNIGKIIGAYDVYGSEYVVSLQGVKGAVNRVTFDTLNFDERAQGWVSRFSYQPDQMFSLRNKFYSVATRSGSALVNGNIIGTTIIVDNVSGFIEQYSSVTGTGIPSGTTVVSYSSGSLVLSQSVSVSNNTLLTFSGVARLFEHYSYNVNRGNFYGVQNNSSIQFIFNSNPTVSKTFKTIGYEGSNGWKVTSFRSDQTGANRTTTGQWNETLDTTNSIQSYGEGEYVVVQTEATTAAASTSVNLTLNTPVYGNIIVDSEVSGQGVVPGTTVVSYNATTGALVLNQAGNVLINTTLFFSAYVSQPNYFSVFGTINPTYDRFYSGFNRKENKYVANLKNNSNASASEVHFGNQMTGIKGFYAIVQMVTDTTTDLGGEKTLFLTESEYNINNGY